MSSHPERQPKDTLAEMHMDAKYAPGLVLGAFYFCPKGKKGVDMCVYSVYNKSIRKAP